MRWAIITRNISESIYWGLELFDSDMEQDALEMLEFIWMSEIGFSSFPFLTRILDIYKSGELDRDTWIQLLNVLSRVEGRDSTVLHLLIRGATTKSDWTPTFPHRDEYATVDDAMKAALNKGKMLDAWLLTRAMAPGEQWSIIEAVAIQKERENYIMELKASTLSDCIRRAAAVVLVSLDDTRWHTSIKPLTERTIPSEVQVSIDEWDNEESLRKRRVYKIRPEALVYLTQRSQESNTVSTEISIQENLINTLQESPYWLNILEQYMEDGIWESATYKEMFFDTYFTCDIPDEWSSQDREKSHGRGLSRSPEVALKRFLDTIFQRSKSLGIWNSVLETYTSTMNWDSLYEDLYETCSIHQGPFKPVVRNFDII